MSVEDQLDRPRALPFVWVAIWQTGPLVDDIDVRVFTSHAAAMAWKEEIAAEYWHEVFPDKKITESEGPGFDYFEARAPENSDKPEMFDVRKREVIL